MIHPLLSRPGDRVHCEQTEKQFVQVAQHAGRIMLNAAKKNSAFEFKFPGFAQKFEEEGMLSVTADSLGLDTMPKRPGALWNAVSGQMVRLTMLPEVVAVHEGFVKGELGWQRKTIYKANVMLC